MNNKRIYGQYFTTTNPFTLQPFIDWTNLIPSFEKQTIIEPFAGANNIPIMLNHKWDCYDIEPQPNEVSKIIQRDTIKDFPKGYKVAITNPPYLSKNSATRRGLEFPDTQYDDLYKLCLEKMLDNCDYVAAIIPETFITSGLFHNRLYCVISLTCKMFDDTDCPVCLALFVPEHNNSFKVYRMNEFIGTYEELKRRVIECNILSDWKFNDPNGELGIWCIDNTKEDSIHFGNGSLIPKDKIKNTSRSLTRVSGIPSNIDLKELIDECNSILRSYRANTSDIFLSSFKGLRSDGKYRRRLDYKTAKNILNHAVINLSNS